MRIQGELLKLGISVSATTIATVLRSSGLGPAPRRIGPSWSEFLSAQAHSMLGGGLHSAMGDDGLEGAAAEPRGPAEDGQARSVEADHERSSTVAAEPRSASHPLPERSSSARPCVLPPTRVPLRLPRSHRSHARDGPPKAGGRSSHSPARRRDVKPQTSRPRIRTNHALGPHGRRPKIFSPDKSAQPIDHHPERASTNRVSLPHRLVGAILVEDALGRFDDVQPRRVAGNEHRDDESIGDSACGLRHERCHGLRNAGASAAFPSTWLAFSRSPNVRQIEGCTFPTLARGIRWSRIGGCAPLTASRFTTFSAATGRDAGRTSCMAVALP